MKEYIDKGALLDAFYQTKLYKLTGKFEKLIRDFPAADVTEVRHGEWIPVDEQYDAFDCSECEAMVSRMMNYCPRCGAKMDGEQQEETP